MAADFSRMVVDAAGRALVRTLVNVAIAAFCIGVLLGLVAGGIR